MDLNDEGGSDGREQTGLRPQVSTHTPEQRL
jgi:hypothetical protein